MQAAWWYLVGDDPHGPVSMEMLEAMLHQGEMTQQSLVWKEGLSSWISMAELWTLRQNHGRQPRPAPLLDLPLAGAWRRFLARMVDICIIAAPLLMLARLLPGFTPWLQRPGSTHLLGLALLPLALLVEAGLFACLGTTPGKALLKVVVSTMDGQGLDGAQYLRRQLRVYGYGFALGLPFASLIAMLAQGLALQAGEPASYDACRFTVRAQRLGRTRLLLLAGLGCALGSAALLG